MSSASRRYYDLQKRTAIVEKFCADYGFELVPLNNGYQLRIEGVLDAYPVNGYWCYMPDGERGSWRTQEDLREILLRKLPVTRKGDPTKWKQKEVVRPLSKSELGALYEEAAGVQRFDVTAGEQPIAGINLTGVNSVTAHVVGTVEQPRKPWWKFWSK